jgi:hypothetical protein
MHIGGGLLFAPLEKDQRGRDHFSSSELMTIYGCQTMCDSIIVGVCIQDIVLKERALGQPCNIQVP